MRRPRWPGTLTQITIASLLMFSCSKRPTPVAYEIKFGKSVGPLDFGMTQDQIKDLLGEPDFQRGKVMNYNGIGLTVAFNRGGTVGAIICGSMDGDTNLVASFKGASKEGVSLGTFSDEVAKVYGPPTEIRNRGEVYHYKSLSADFAFINNRVVCITVRPASAARTNEPLANRE